jgi:hypothetical protein
MWECSDLLNFVIPTGAVHRKAMISGAEGSAVSRDNERVEIESERGPVKPDFGLSGDLGQDNPVAKTKATYATKTALCGPLAIPTPVPSKSG